MKNYIQLILISLILSCSTKGVTSLTVEPTVNTIFTSKEVNDLNTILDFFESQICELQQVDKENIDDCYQFFFLRMKEQLEEGEFDSKIPFDEQNKLYSQIDSHTFNEIWKISSKIKSTEKSIDTLKSIIWNHDGKYIYFLKEFAKENAIVKNYYDTYKMAGDISPSMVAGLIVYSDKYDIKDIRMRLLIAIHYLTLNDDYKREEKIKMSN